MHCRQDGGHSSTPDPVVGRPLLWGSPEAVLGVSGLFGKWSQEVPSGACGSQTGKGRHLVKGCYQADSHCGQPGLSPIGHLGGTAEDTQLSAVPLRSKGAGHLFTDFCPSLVRTAPGWARRCFRVGAGRAGGNRIRTGCRPPLPNSLAVPTAHAESQSRKRKGPRARGLVAFWVVTCRRRTGVTSACASNTSAGSPGTDPSEQGPGPSPSTLCGVSPSVAGARRMGVGPAGGKPGGPPTPNPRPGTQL